MPLDTHAKRALLETADDLATAVRYALERAADLDAEAFLDRALTLYDILDNARKEVLHT